jgi:hypothetical protein
LAAGVLPGDPSLYPSSLDDVYGQGGPRTAPVPATTAEPTTRAG